ANAAKTDGLHHRAEVWLRERRPAEGMLVQERTGRGVVPRVEPVRGGLRGEHVDLGRQFIVDAAAKRVGRHRGADVEVRDLRERVDAGVGSARSVQLEIAAPRDRAYRAIDLTLHGPRVFLNLPAAVARPG